MDIDTSVSSVNEDAPAITINDATSEVQLGLRQSVLKKASEAKVLFSPRALELICSLTQEKALSVVGKCLEQKVFVITEELCREVIASIEVIEKAQVIVQFKSFKPLNAEVASQLEISEDMDVTGKSRCTGTIEEFVGLFRDRFRRLKGIMKGRVSELPLIPISGIKGSSRGKTGRIIGIVFDKQTTKNGHVLIELEDEESSIKCLVMKDSPIREKADDVILDEVIAIDGSCAEELFIAKDIIWPEVPISPIKKSADEDVSVICISDIHVGSRLFLKDSFGKFLSFLNGEGTDSEREIAGKVKYISIAGDLVDGIGVYPDQEKELATKDIYTQYEILNDYLKLIPEHIEVLVAPGNHDAVRSAVPQPRLSPEFTKGTAGYKNIHFLGNPVSAKIHGFKHVIYHGASMYSMINSLPKLRNTHLNPEKVGVEMLRRRLLNPIYGDNVPFAPEKRDYTLLEEVPDIFHFGDIHRNGYTSYHGVMVINGGCWQGKTDYQVKLGHEPTPCQVPIYNLKSNNLQVLNFGGDKII